MVSYAWPASGGNARPFISVLADALHVAAMSLWLGGLIMLEIFVLPAPMTTTRPDRSLWSIWPLRRVHLLLTGIAQSILQIGTLRCCSTLDTRLVLAKAGCSRHPADRRWLTPVATAMARR